MIVQSIYYCQNAVQYHFYSRLIATPFHQYAVSRADENACPQRVESLLCFSNIPREEENTKGVYREEKKTTRESRKDSDFLFLLVIGSVSSGGESLDEEERKLNRR